MTEKLLENQKIIADEISVPLSKKELELLIYKLSDMPITNKQALNIYQKLTEKLETLESNNEWRKIENWKRTSEKVYTAYYSQIDFTKDFCEQNMSHIIHLQKHQGYCNTPLFKFDGKTTALVYTLYSVSQICTDLLEHIENEIVKLSEAPEVEEWLEKSTKNKKIEQIKFGDKVPEEIKDTDGFLNTLKEKLKDYNNRIIGYSQECMGTFTVKDGKVTDIHLSGIILVPKFKDGAKE